MNHDIGMYAGIYFISIILTSPFVRRLMRPLTDQFQATCHNSAYKRLENSGIMKVYVGSRCQGGGGEEKERGSGRRQRKEERKGKQEQLPSHHAYGGGGKGRQRIGRDRLSSLFMSGIRKIKLITPDKTVDIL